MRFETGDLRHEIKDSRLVKDENKEIRTTKWLNFD